MIFLEIECENAENFDFGDSIECQWYNNTQNRWISDGCTTIRSDIQRDDGSMAAECECTHLTAFAIIQDTLKAESM